MKRSVKQIIVAGEVRYKYKKIIQILRPQNDEKSKSKISAWSTWAEDMKDWLKSDNWQKTCGTI